MPERAPIQTPNLDGYGFAPLPWRAPYRFTFHTVFGVAESYGATRWRFER